MHKRAMRVLLSFLFLFALPASAQEFEDGPGPGLGGIIIDASTSGDPATFNPLIGGDGASSAVL